MLTSKNIVHIACIILESYTTEIEPSSYLYMYVLLLLMRVVYDVAACR